MLAHISSTVDSGRVKGKMFWKILRSRSGSIVLRTSVTRCFSEEVVVKSLSRVNYYQGNEDVLFGDYQSIASESQIHRNYEAIDQITATKSQLDDVIWLRGRVHSLRVKGNACFLILRSQNSSTIQIAYFKDKNNPIESKKLIKYVEALTPESIVDVRGRIVGADVHSCTQRDVEIHLQQIFVVSRAPAVLPFRLEDAAR
jgi:aspartyl-tRNA synthetase